MAAVTSRTRASAHVHDALAEFGPEPEPREWDAFAERVFFAGGGFSADNPGRLLDVLGEARRQLGSDPELVCYLAVPPAAFAGLTKALGQHELAPGARVVYEKPFGTSRASFRELDRVVHSVLDEKQVYRIDHFLGKEATQDLHLLRFANGSSAAYWHREHVESVQIDVPETLGISDRAQFYDATGAVLDMLVTHLFQVAAEVAMEPPASLGPADLQDAREKVISCFRPLDPAEVVLGQFDGYRDVPGVHPRSTRDTFVAARLWIDNPRWRGVPFYLRTRQAAGRVGAAGQPDPPRAARPAIRSAAPRRQRAVLLPGRRRGDRPVSGGQKTRPGAGARRGPCVDPAGQPARRRSAAALRPADPRRLPRRPLPVHSPGRARRRLGHSCTAAIQATQGQLLSARIMGAGTST
jgi:hypothetical protein